MRLSRAETETTIRWDAEEKVAHIWTNDGVYIRKLDRLCAESPNEYRLVKENPNGRFYDAPAKLIRFRKPASEAQRMANAANIVNARFLPKNPTNSTEKNDSPSEGE